MSRKNYEVVTLERFVDRYLDSPADAFVFQQSAVQVYPLSLAVARITPPTPLFKAEYSFLLLFLTGGGQQQVDNETLDLQANDVLFIREGHLNAIKSIGEGTQGYYIHLENVLLPRIFTDSALLHRLTFYPKHAVSPADMAWLGQCCELILSQTGEQGYAEEIQCALLRAMVLKVAQASATTLCQPDRPSEITMRFKELVYEHVGTHRVVAFYADALAVSENYLNRCVNQLTRKPPKQHITEMVILRSKVLLQDRSKDIAQVAVELNFADPSYFGRLFRQVTQQTPTEYRNAFWQGLSE
ncbi:helix-turn-helix domain-containing protein [Hymenobacter canadensis]|uniref:Helix-turn-helix domain-containing protein n=1 Tax=Hymenobacter canadensis TaxID=2999067 RepID=A0ABY7LXU6_9BACT|nr:helix-turn-helix domain-containing protein [Hymenobacter canadensis]WBA44095.1 helix-turn-helix domain-containing protein [Hymenobacter canadensis]